MMNKFLFLFAVSMGLILVFSGLTRADETISAGFAKIKITPPAGTPMSGFGDRDYNPLGSRGVHDDVYARALYLNQGSAEILILGLDLLFLSRDESDRFKGAIGRTLDISPVRMLVNTSHQHTGPKVGDWYYTPRVPAYIDLLERAVVDASVGAKKTAEKVTLWAGSTRTKVPLSRRKKLPDGTIDFAPNPDGAVLDVLPLLLFKNARQKPVFLLFSVSCHPSTIKGDDLAYLISAEYPGAAMDELDKYLGRPGSLFLQGAGGDAKPSVIGKGLDKWRAGDWADVSAVGKMIREEVVAEIEKGLMPVSPSLKAAMVESIWPLSGRLTREELKRHAGPSGSGAAAVPVEVKARRAWAEEKLALIDHGYGLPDSVPILIQGIRFAPGVRLIAVEGELCADLGLLVHNSFKTGTTFTLGYSNGTQMYLPSSRMVDEGGYEVESYWEYKQPAPLAKGMEQILLGSLKRLKSEGID